MVAQSSHPALIERSHTGDVARGRALVRGWEHAKETAVRRRRHFARWVQVVLMGLALLVALAPTRTFAADIRQGDVVTVGPTQTINDDLYAFGETVDIQGRVNGDVVAAGGTVTVHGTVTGDLLAAGGTTTMAGTVGGTVRAAGGTTTIEGPVGKDLLVTGGTLRLGPGARGARPADRSRVGDPGRPGRAERASGQWDAAA